MSPAEIKAMPETRGLATIHTSLLNAVFSISAAKVRDEEGEYVSIGYDGEAGAIYAEKWLEVMTAYVWNQIMMS
jgi:hypothetical protein